jgi:hypothetical protein
MTVIPSCLSRHDFNDLIALSARVVENNLYAELDMCTAGDLQAAAYHADAAERWSLIAFAASCQRYGSRHG